jgi:hypothetical protein
MSNYAINHCELVEEIRNKNLDSDDFKEEVMNRVPGIIESIKTGKTTKPHKLAGVELVAFSLAIHVIEEGARQIASDLDVDLDRLKKHAVSEHISSC